MVPGLTKNLLKKINEKLKKSFFCTKARLNEKNESAKPK